jgi:hypothetical protein
MQPTTAGPKAESRTESLPAVSPPPQVAPPAPTWSFPAAIHVMRPQRLPGAVLLTRPQLAAVAAAPWSAVAPALSA